MGEGETRERVSDPLQKACERDGRPRFPCRFVFTLAFYALLTLCKLDSQLFTQLSLWTRLFSRQSPLRSSHASALALNWGFFDHLRDTSERRDIKPQSTGNINPSGHSCSKHAD